MMLICLGSERSQSESAFGLASSQPLLGSVQQVIAPEASFQIDHKSEARDFCYQWLVMKSLPGVIGSRCCQPCLACGGLCTWAAHITAVGARISMSFESEGCQRNDLLRLLDVQCLVLSRRQAASGDSWRLREEGRVIGNTGFLPRG